MIQASLTTVSEEVVPQWEDVNEPLNVMHTRVKNILQVDNVSKLTKSKEQQTRDCVEAVMQTIFQEWHFQSDNVANSEKTIGTT